MLKMEPVMTTDTAASGRELLRRALPLILTNSSFMVMNFTERFFLSRSSPDALAAALPAGTMAYAGMALWMGLAGYVHTFVAQYHGAGRPDRISAALWQGIYIALAGGVILFILAHCAQPLFAWAGHAPAVREQEAAYLKITLQMAWLPLLSTVLSAFWCGRGRTGLVMAANLFGVGLNIPLSYWLIFGGGGVPALGITGAAWASVLASLATTGLLFIQWLRPAHCRQFSIWANRRPDRELLGRLVRFGLPSGLGALQDVLFFSVFLLLIGRLGTKELALSNIALGLTTLAFGPMIGLQGALTVMVGAFMGGRRPDAVRAITRKALAIILGYEILVAGVYLGLPHTLLRLFTSQEGPAELAFILEKGRFLLVLMAIYSLFDSLNLAFSGTLRGAGDTRFIMTAGMILTWGIFTPGMWVIVQVSSQAFIALWCGRRCMCPPWGWCFSTGTGAAPGRACPCWRRMKSPPSRVWNHIR
jgi:MATE family multidrug resistance protein